jgi:hypothetical protein
MALNHFFILMMFSDNASHRIGGYVVGDKEKLLSPFATGIRIFTLKRVRGRYPDINLTCRHIRIKNDPSASQMFLEGGIQPRQKGRLRFPVCLSPWGGARNIQLTAARKTLQYP